MLTLPNLNETYVFFFFDALFRIYIQIILKSVFGYLSISFSYKTNYIAYRSLQWYSMMETCAIVLYPILR